MRSAHASAWRLMKTVVAHEPMRFSTPPNRPRAPAWNESRRWGNSATGPAGLPSRPCGQKGTPTSHACGRAGAAGGSGSARKHGPHHAKMQIRPPCRSSSARRSAQGVCTLAAGRGQRLHGGHQPVALIAGHDLQCGTPTARAWQGHVGARHGEARWAHCAGVGSCATRGMSRTPASPHYPHLVAINEKVLRGAVVVPLAQARGRHRPQLWAVRLLHGGLSAR